MDADPFKATCKNSKKSFLMALKNIAPADDIKRLLFVVHHPASEVHMVLVVKHNLLSMNQFTEANYITVFDEDQVNIYDATNTKGTVSRGSVLRGWRL